MDVAAFSPIGPKFELAATVANLAQAMSPATNPAVPMNIRVTQNSAGDMLFAMGDSTVNALTDPQAMAMPTGERVFAWKPGATHCAVALRAGTGNATVQLGWGV